MNYTNLIFGQTIPLKLGDFKLGIRFSLLQ